MDRFTLRYSILLIKQYVIGLFVIVSMSLSSVSDADNILAKEYFLKAAFLYNFARLVEWPADTFNTEEAPINLCFMGDDPFDKALKTIQNKKINHRPFIIKRNISLINTSQCHILYVSQSESSKTQTILDYTRQYSVLTVSDLPGFTQKNGHIRFFLSNDETLRLEVNLEAIKQSRLHMSSRILTLATIVHSDKAIKND